MLTIDLGASNGRAMLGTLLDGKYYLKQIYRFSNDPVQINGILYWDLPRLLHEVKQSIVKVKIETGEFPDSIGIDAWGASFGLLDKDGDLLANPMHYRNDCVDEFSKELESIIDKESLFLKLGYYPNNIFNLYFLFYLLKKKPEVLKAAKHFVNIADLLNVFLTGKIVSERTSVAPSLLYNIKSSQWDWELIDEFGFERELFAHKIVEPGTVIGGVRKEVCEDLNIDKEIKVVAVVGHDSTSAAMATPNQHDEKDYGYLNCGTWSVLGAEVQKINPTKEVFNLGFTYDEGVAGKKHLRININSLWILQECKRYWELKGENYSHSELVQLARDSKPFISRIDINDAIFANAGNMPNKIIEHLKKTQQTLPKSVGEYSRIIIESLAYQYGENLKNLEKILGYKLQKVYMMGGGIQNKLLCQLTANFMKREIYAGPVEATAAGNLIFQSIALGIVKDIKEFRELFSCGDKIIKYIPDKHNSD